MPIGEGDPSPSSCSSSIGRNSDCSRGSTGSDGDESEVQSELKGPLDTMDALEDCLPIRRGISNFYCGKSKSFTSLVDASSSAKDLAKPDNAYNRKRKNILAFTKNWDCDYGEPLLATGNNLCKRLMTTNLSLPALALTRTLSSSDSNSNSSSEEEQKLSPPLPPRHPCRKPAFQFPAVGPQNCTLSTRSFSLADLQDASKPTPASSTW